MTHGGTVGYYLSRFHRYTTMRSGHQGGGIAATHVFMQRRLNHVDIFIRKNRYNDVSNLKNHKLYFENTL